MKASKGKTENSPAKRKPRIFIKFQAQNEEGSRKLLLE